MSIKVEEGVPIPNPYNNRGGTKTFKYPWESMNIGDSFVIECKQPFSTASRAGRQYSRKFAVRTVDGVTRVWRIE